jgi:hypothetical protein
LKQDIETIDPTRNALASHIRFLPDGGIVGLTVEGREFISKFRLDVTAAAQERTKWLTILRLKSQYPDNQEVAGLFRQSFGFPEEMPDLRSPAKRLKGNFRPEGVHGCFFLQKLQGSLPEVY